MAQSIIEIEEQISVEPLNLGGLNHIPVLSVRTFLICFLMEWNDNPTYDNKGKRHTDGGRRRSIGDIYRIAINYIDTDLKNVARELLYLCDNVKGFRTSYCSTINKRVYYYSSNKSNGVISSRIADEYDLHVDDWRRLISGKPIQNPDQEPLTPNHEDVTYVNEAVDAFHERLREAEAEGRRRRQRELQRDMEAVHDGLFVRFHTE